MLKRFIQVVSVLLVQLLAFEPASAAIGAWHAAVTPFSPASSALYQRQALVTSSMFIIRPALIAREFSARVYESLESKMPHAAPWVSSLVSASLVALALRALGYGEFQEVSFGMGAMFNRLFGTPAERALRHREKDHHRKQDALWERFGYMQLGELGQHHPLTPDLSYMMEPQVWGAPTQIPSLAQRSFDLIEDLLTELELNQHLTPKKALVAVEALLTAAYERKEPFTESIYARQYDTTSEGGPALEAVHTYSFVSPYALKPLLIALQLHRLTFSNDMPDSEIQRRAVTAVLEGPFMSPVGMQDVIEKGFPSLPQSREEQRVLLRDYLIWLAQSPASSFDVYKIDQVLTDELLNLLRPDQDVLIMDPYTWNLKTQRAVPIGVLPMPVAYRIGAVQLAVNAFIQLNVNEIETLDNLSEREFLFVVRARHTTFGGTYSIFGGRHYTPGIDRRAILKERVRHQLGLPAYPDYESDENWERVNTVSAPVYVGPNGQDVQLRINYIYHPSPETVTRIEQRVQEMDRQKLQFENAAAYEAYLAQLAKSEYHGRFDVRGVIKLHVGELLGLVKAAESYRVRGVPLPDERKIVYEEQFAGGKEKTLLEVNPDLLQRLIAPVSSPVRLRLNAGRRNYTREWHNVLEGVEFARHQGARMQVTLMQARWRAVHEAFSRFYLGWVIEVVAAVVEEFENYFKHQTLAEFVAKHEETLFIHRLGWLNPDHPHYSEALRTIDTLASRIRATLDPLWISPLGRFALAVTAHIWLNSVRPRLPSPKLIQHVRMAA